VITRHRPGYFGTDVLTGAVAHTEDVVATTLAATYRLPVATLAELAGHFPEQHQALVVAKRESCDYWTDFESGASDRTGGDACGGTTRSDADGGPSFGASHRSGDSGSHDDGSSFGAARHRLFRRSPGR